MSHFHHVVGKQVISAKKKLEDAIVLDPQKFVNPEDSNDSEAATPEQEGGSRGIRRWRRVTQQQNRRRAFDAIADYSMDARTLGCWQLLRVPFAGWLAWLARGVSRDRRCRHHQRAHGGRYLRNRRFRNRRNRHAKIMYHRGTDFFRET
jgi:hypothetical protein